MALNNCTINSSSVDVAKNTQLGSGVANQVLTITPSSGFVVRASDFTQATDLTASPFAQQIQSITLTDSSTAYALDNTVLVTIDLKDTFAPAADTGIVIDIDGSAILSNQKPLSVAGTITNTLTNATVNTATQPYSGTGEQGTQATLFTRTYTAASGKFFEDEPTYVLVSSASSNYEITSSTATTSGFITAKTFTVKYTFNSNSSSNTITFTANAAGTIPGVENKKISSFSHIQDPLSLDRTKRVLNIYGDAGAQVKLSMARSASPTAYNFTNSNFTNGAVFDVTIPSTGVFSTIIDYPVISSAETYTFTLNTTSYSGTDLSTSIDPNSDGVGTFAVSALANVTYTVATNSASSRSFTSTPSQVYSGSVNHESSESLINKTISLVLTDDVSMALTRLPLTTDFVAVNCAGESGESDMIITGITSSGTTYTQASNNVYSSLTFTINALLRSFGEAVSTHTLALDNFINIPPVAHSESYTATEDTNLAIDLSTKGTDANGDTLTFSIVSNPANATVSLSGAIVTFAPSANYNGSTSFTWKCNDGKQDSNIATATVNVTAVADAPTDIALSATAINENNSINAVIGALSSVDPDGSGSYTYTLVSGTGSTDNSSFNISGSNLRAGIAFDYETKNSYSIRIRSTDSAHSSLYVEKAFTITINDVGEGVITRFQVDLYNTSGNYTATHFIHGSQTCQSGNLAVTCMSFGSLTNKWLRLQVSCNGAVFVGKIIGSAANGTPTIHAVGDSYYNSRVDAQNNQNSVTC
jgi:hypothetical protein